MRTGIYGIASTREVQFPDAHWVSEQNGCQIHVGLELPHHKIQQACLWADEDGISAAHGVWLNAPSRSWSHKRHSSKVKKATSSPEEFAAVEGPLQGLNWNAKSKSLLLHVDFARQHPLFWSSFDSGIVFAHRLDLLISLMRLNGQDIVCDPEGGAMLLTYGSILGDQTLIKGVQKLMPGHSLVWTPAGVVAQEREPLGSLKRDVDNVEDAAELLDSAFNDSVEQMCIANEHANCEQHNLLSGGLDSRLVALATSKHAHGGTLSALCFSAADSLDASISKSVAQDHSWGYRHHDLANGAYMVDFSSVFHYDGCINCLASAHHYEALTAWKLNNVGLLASGQGGEFFTDHQHWHFDGEAALKSLELYSGVRDLAMNAGLRAWRENPDIQRFKVINRGFIYTNSAAYSTVDFGVLWSPIVSSRMVKAALRLDKTMLRNQKAYLFWSEKTFPQAQHHVWERYKTKPIAGFRLRLFQTWCIWQARLRRVFGVRVKGGMSPIDHWLQTNKEVKRCFDETFEGLKHWLEHYPDLRREVERDYPSMNATNKASVLTLLKATERYLSS